MIGKVAAGVVCGAAAAVPGRYMLELFLGGLAPLMGGKDQLDLSILVAPYAVAALVFVICLTAPNTIGAWLRGCLMTAVICLMTALQGVQCFGMDYLFGEVFSDPIARDAAMVACPRSLTPLLSTIITAGAVVFGIGAFVAWRNARRGQEL